MVRSRRAIGTAPRAESIVSQIFISEFRNQLHDLKKKRAGYPQDNIGFEDSMTAVLIQNRQEAMRCPIEDTDALAHLLKLFFEHEREEPRHRDPAHAPRPRREVIE
jgi:hypothetical protein